MCFIFTFSHFSLLYFWVERFFLWRPLCLPSCLSAISNLYVLPCLAPIGRPHTHTSLYKYTYAGVLWIEPCKHMSLILYIWSNDFYKKRFERSARNEPNYQKKLTTCQCWKVSLFHKVKVHIITWKCFFAHMYGRKDFKTQILPPGGATCFSHHVMPLPSRLSLFVSQTLWDLDFRVDHLYFLI